MSKYLLIILFVALHGLRGGKLSLVKSAGAFHQGVRHLDIRKQASSVRFVNADSTETVDRDGEFSFWSNGFITVNPGEMINFPKAVQVSSITDSTTSENTYVITSNVYEDRTKVQLLSITSMKEVHICFRGYVKNGKFYGEVTLRRPDRASIAERIIEKKKFGGHEKFSKNAYGAMVAVWACERGDFFKIVKGSTKVHSALPDVISATASCYSKEFVGNLYVEYEPCGISYHESLEHYI